MVNHIALIVKMMIKFMSLKVKTERLNVPSVKSNSALLSDGSTAGIGYSFKADIKYFPGTNNLLDGIYLSPEISYRHYSIDYPSNPANAGTASTIPGHTNKAELKLLLGHEAESDWIDNLFFDWYVGIGVRNTSALQYVPDANIPTQADRNSVSFTRPSFYFGIKIGIGF